MHKLSQMFDVDKNTVRLTETTYSVDRSIAINYYLFGKWPFLIGYPVCNQETGLAKWQ